ncbi:MAG: UDP-N-acetylmuramoyl-tripeptide--D-alanyl-D-alanine ligase [Negativicutes bacterium]|nr:UDP-N-acetylmuramoyl-tripeptide--D-alanyl-D-alanine ligase [Negativicutes bacterium]
MAEFTISEVLAATGGELIREHKKVFTGVSTDTRTLKPGHLFIALKGEKFDAHDFLLRASDSGATGVVISNRDAYIPDKMTAIIVSDTLVALQELAGFHRRRFSIPMIGVTGSNGKTTTKDMIAAMLGSRLSVLKTEANYNNEIGLPLTLLNLTKDHQAAVVEMGMRARGEIRRLAEIAAPTVAVITNVGETHIELLGSEENIAAAKAELVESLGTNSLAVLNGDIPLVRAMRSKAAGRVITYGFSPDVDLRADNVSDANQEITFDCIWSQGVFTVTLPTVGRHNVYNALAAIAVGLDLNLHPLEICAGIKKFVPSAMRLHIEQIGDFTVINDAYNASPLSMHAAIETLATVARGRKVAVLGDMLELGEVAVEAHCRIGHKLADEGVQVVITVGQLAGHIASAALEDGVDVTVACPGHEEAQEALRKLLRPGDTILIKGSRGMKMEKMLAMFKK